MRLEPDNGKVRMSPDQMAVYLVAAGDAARKAGFQRMRFSMPSTLDPNLVPEYVQEGPEPSGSRRVRHRALVPPLPHTLPATFDQLRSLSKEHGWTTAMLEHIRADHRELAEDLTKANVSAWAQYTLVGPHGGDNWRTLFLLRQCRREPGRWDAGRRRSRSSSTMYVRELPGWKRRATIRNSCRWPFGDRTAASSPSSALREPPGPTSRACPVATTRSRLRVRMDSREKLQ